LVSDLVLGLRWFARKAITFALGSISRSSSNRFAASTEANWLTPVRLPPGRLKLATTPNSTGSTPVAKTIGIVAVAALAASAVTDPPVAAITGTLRLTSSAAKAGNRSYRPSAQRNAIARPWPST
jgi:hypothetical protein